VSSRTRCGIQAAAQMRDRKTKKRSSRRPILMTIPDRRCASSGMTEKHA
jgi:hypothetical protein